MAFCAHRPEDAASLRNCGTCLCAVEVREETAEWEQERPDRPHPPVAPHPEY